MFIYITYSSYCFNMEAMEWSCCLMRSCNRNRAVYSEEDFIFFGCLSMKSAIVIMKCYS